MRRIVLVLVSIGLLGVVAFTEPASAASCSVQREGTAFSYPSLQAAVDDSMDGDRLLVSGTCVGGTDIFERMLVIVGVSTDLQPTPTLDGGGASRVLISTLSDVTIVDVTITGGSASQGGGIYQADGRLALRGTTTLTANSAEWGAGIKNYEGTLIVTGAASISANTASKGGGGIYTVRGLLTIRSSASIVGNAANRTGGGIRSWEGEITLQNTATIRGNNARWGGGIYNDRETRLTVRGHGSITRNSARWGGGIYDAYYTTTVLEGSASIARNSAVVRGGGIYRDSAYHPTIGWGGPIYVCSDDVRISPNRPDDPPKVRRACP